MLSSIDRRLLLKLGSFGLGALSMSGGAMAFNSLTHARGFTHGIASGEPGSTSVLLWTRYIPDHSDIGRLEVEISEYPDFRRIVSGGAARTGAFRDWTVKITVDNLRPKTRYYYRFIAADGTRSQVGQTRTLPDGAVDQYRIAIFSCANMPYGYFNAYGHAAERDDIDLTIHLGDYYYEYGPGTYPALKDAVPGRPLPDAEAFHLADYRIRHASYRADPDLQRLHQRHAMVALWDDHEIANNSWEGGSSGHSADKGDFVLRKAAAVQAYREWMPVSDTPWEYYDIGNLARFHRTETRILARSKAPSVSALHKEADPLTALKRFRDGPWLDPAATMMGSQQENWLANQLKESTSRQQHWQIVGSGTVLSSNVMPPEAVEWVAGSGSAGNRRFVEMAALATSLGLPVNFDSWGGYPAARSRFLTSAQEADANLIFIAGDTHNGWAYDLVEDGQKAGVEFATHSVTSPGIEEAAPGYDARRISNSFVEASPNLRWCDVSQRGYMTLDMTPERAVSEWLFLDTVARRSFALAGTHRLAVRKDQRSIEAV
ncbi:alkaline phosphatase D family protein [Parasphingorhabdus sp.]|uniref:alkaline phosphatase D family protein n=1 Tax=Parasphingorhabdus sp. TaxID=2709688 RepID=UPI003A8D5FBA